MENNVEQYGIREVSNWEFKLDGRIVIINYSRGDEITYKVPNIVNITINSALMPENLFTLLDNPIRQVTSEVLVGRLSDGANLIMIQTYDNIQLTSICICENRYSDENSIGWLIKFEARLISTKLVESNMKEQLLYGK